MARSDQRLEWHLGSEDEVDASHWPPLVDGNRNGTQQTTVFRLQRICELLFIVVVLYGVAVYFIWHHSMQRIAMLEQEVTALHREQHRAEENNDDSKVMSGLGGARDSHQFETEYLRFEVSKRTIDWMASAHVHYEAGERTVEAMYSVAAASDRSYQQLHQEFGLTLPVPANKLKIFVDHLPDGANGVSVYSHSQRVDYLFVPLSPASTAQRKGITQIDVVTNDIYRELTDYVLGRAIENREMKPQWKAMTVALQFYLQRENGNNPNWRSHAVFLPHRHAAQNRSIDLVYQVIGEEVGTDDEWFRRTPTTYTIADPLIEFILETYGYAQIPLLLDAFAEHETWETLAPAVFGTSARRFEEDWHIYLKQQYPLPQD